MPGGPAAVPGQRFTASFYNENIRSIWQPLTLLNGWTSYGSPYATAQYRLVDTVTCEIIGLLNSGTITEGTTVFALPAGYYNPNNEQAALMYLAYSASAPTFTALHVQTSGDCEVGAGAVTGSDYWLHATISLDA